MATLPAVIGYDTDIKIQAQPSKTWIIDRVSNQVAFMDAGLEAVRQAVDIALNVERFRWQIYNANFGSELATLIGDDPAFILSELPRFVEEALSTDDRVTRVTDYNFRAEGNSLTVSFLVHTVYGEFIEEVEL